MPSARPGARLDAVDRAVLDAGQASGELGRALRDRARARRTHVVTAGLLFGRLLYPAIVLVMACAVTLLLASLGLSGLGWLSAVVVAGALAATVGARLFWSRTRNDPAFTGSFIPGVADLLTAAGEVPYLDAMRALHGAGVPIDHAHDIAMRTSPIAHVRARLTVAARGLGDRRGYVESLATASALSERTRQILETGEHAGRLEEALQHAATRRREQLERGVRRAVVIVGGVAYATAVIVVLLVVLDFYGGLYPRLMGR